MYSTVVHGPVLHIAQLELFSRINMLQLYSTIDTWASLFLLSLRLAGSLLLQLANVLVILIRLDLFICSCQPRLRVQASSKERRKVKRK